MFITRDAYKSSLSALFLDDGVTGWSATELLLQRVWFLVHIEEFDATDDPEFSRCRTVLLFDFHSVEQFLLSERHSKVRLKSVHIVTPSHINGSNSWEMDQLRAVWQGREPDGEFNIPMNIFETVSGKRYSDSFSLPSSKSSMEDTLKFEFSH